MLQVVIENSKNSIIWSLRSAPILFTDHAQHQHPGQKIQAYGPAHKKNIKDQATTK